MEVVAGAGEEVAAEDTRLVLESHNRLTVGR